MTPEEVREVASVYRKLISSEKNLWDTLDDYLEMLDYLTDDELHIEASVLYSKHENRDVRCDKDHPKQDCFVPPLVRVASLIIEHYIETDTLHIRNRYILQYYIALTQANFIRVIPRR